MSIQATPGMAISVGRWALLGLATVALTGCAVLSEDKIDYRSAKKASTLDIPPDLTQLTRDSRYLAPSASVSASSLAGKTSANEPARNAAAPSVNTLQLERAGSQRWLVVSNQTPAQLWEPLREFWRDNGLALSTEDPKLGIMETDWAENRAKLPQDLVRATLGKVFDSLYSTGERDKFRTRIESRANGGSEIYISHRGMMEVYTNTQKDSTVWQPRPADPELEAEFLQRLMLKLGSDPESAKTTVAKAAKPTPDLPVQSLNGQTVLTLNEGFDRAWRRVGLALDRSGFTVEDRDRSQGVYFVRYVPANDPKVEKTGFWSTWWNGKKAVDNTPQRYRVQVSASGSVCQVAVLDPQGQPSTQDSGQRILQLLASDLK